MRFLRSLPRPTDLPWTIQVERVMDERPHVVVRIAELPGFVVGVEPHENLYEELRAALDVYLEACASLGSEPTGPSFVVRRGTEYGRTSTCGPRLEFA